LTGVPVSRATNDGYPSKAMPAAANRALGLRCGDDGFYISGQRRLDCAACARKRCAAIGSVDSAQFYRRVVAGVGIEQIDRAVVPVRIGNPINDPEIG
jgi:hypothetical protein